MTEFDKCTCVKVNKDKMDLIKAKGLNLQDLLDNAMDEELGLVKVSNIQQKIEDLTLKIDKLEKEKEESVKDIEKKVNLLVKTLIESKKKKEDFYNNQIKFLQLEIEYLKKQ